MQRSSSRFRRTTYKVGERNGPSRAGDEQGRLVSECCYRDEMLDGEAKKWRYEGRDWGEIEIACHQQHDSPYMIERFAFAEGQRGLIERIVPDSDGATLYQARKSDCDSTRIDTLYGARMTIEIHDFREGVIRSLERYDASSYSGTLIPHGVRPRTAGGDVRPEREKRIASGVSYFEGELELSAYRHVVDQEAGARFDLLFWITLPEVPAPVWTLHWVGENSLLLVMEKSCLRADIAPESLAGQGEEPAEC